MIRAAPLANPVVMVVVARRISMTTAVASAKTPSGIKSGKKNV
jgi:hypothetical protein